VTDHAKLRELAKAATPGPWEYREVEGSGAVAHPTGWVDAIFPFGAKENVDAIFCAAANPAMILALLDEIASLHKSLSEALLDAERAREERNREHVRLNAKWMAKCEELRKDAAEIVAGEIEDVIYDTINGHEINPAERAKAVIAAIDTELAKKEGA
jgi:Ead/Ea22-like protein